MSGPNLHEWQRAKLQGMGELPSSHYSPPSPRSLSLSYVLEGETKRGAVMPMTAPHSADRDQWLMKGFGSPPDISHSLPP